MYNGDSCWIPEISILYIFPPPSQPANLEILFSQLLTHCYSYFIHFSISFPAQYIGSASFLSHSYGAPSIPFMES